MTAGEMVSATSIDEVRIEVLGESRAVRCSGGQWVEYREKAMRLAVEVEELREACKRAFYLLRVFPDYRLESEEAALLKELAILINPAA